ncbi:MAG: phosphatase PAP2 family protein [Gemmatimonadaceae bacterium]|jgi:membrane-associated phospholipid phosphatase|nr:phosphatase PAP2 family protein [Gemmatimonadaceae bacterium]
MRARPTSRVLRTLIALGTIAALGACDRTVQPTEVLPALEVSNVDADAGSWRPIVLASPEQVPVPAPLAVTSAEYRAELEAVVRAQRTMTPAQRANMEYWSSGGVLRWNQVMRELVARYNLPPAPRADGTYVFPDADNPFADPNFPFANPPYAARAYAYVSVAQYDALKAAWFWKYRHNRPAPSRTNATISTRVAATTLPSYPSEDAVLSAVSAEMLRLLFPASVEQITRLAADQRDAALLSGRATASDIAAGVALGRAVAAAVIARAGADGMRNAVGNASLWASLADSVRARGETPWTSLESPARPPMLPLFGRVAAWTMTPAQLLADGPPPPPSTNSAQFRDELAEVRRTVDGLTRAQYAIALKWNDGAGTYTPPGHWNDIAAEPVRDARMSEVRAARTFAWLNMAMHDAAVACWGVKYQYFNPRPSQVDRAIRTPIGLPNFPAYPSGHSTFSAAAATVLGHLFPARATEFAQMADEAGISRLYGGIHYRSDITEGKAHGTRIGAIVVRAAQTDGAR